MPDDIDPPGEGAFRTPIQVRFRDVDSMGHVNNAVYASYLEQARAEFFAAVVGERLDAVRTVLVTQRIDYRRPVEWGAEVEVALAVDGLGRSSLPMRYGVRADGALAAAGRTVQVVVDDDGDSRRVPDAWRERIAARQSEHGDGRAGGREAG